MIVKALPKRGTTLHVWDTKKYYPDVEYDVSDELGSVLVRERIAVKVVQKKKPVPKPPDPPAPPMKRGPGRPRKYPRD